MAPLMVALRRGTEPYQKIRFEVLKGTGGHTINGHNITKSLLFFKLDGECLSVWLSLNHTIGPI